MNGPLRVVCDENLSITPALEAIASSITCLPGRSITQTDLGQVDALFVRSVTRVDEALLRGSAVRFVGTATAGIEHIDVDAIQRMGISFAAAAGANANAVVEYIITAFAFSGRLSSILAGGSVGVVGLGYVGRLLCQRIQSLGGRVVAYDPLLRDWPRDVTRASLADVLSQPVVSLHAALHDSAPYASRHLISTANVSCFSEGQLLVNAGRGGLITRDALVALYHKGISLVLDTWPDEPSVDGELLSMVLLATPHIAGYSLEAKVKATDMLVRSIIDHKLVDISSLNLDLNDSIGSAQHEIISASDLSGILLAAYNIAEDDLRFREAADLHGGVVASAFDALRRDYPLRFELRGRKVQRDNQSDKINTWADALGFTTNKRDE